MNMENNDRNKLTKTGTIVAVVVIILWFALGLLLILNVSANETIWARYIWLFSSVEAVAFAAIGALLGTSVQKQRVEDAQKRETAASEKAEINQKAANNGRLLAQKVKKLSVSSLGSSGVERVSTSSTDTDMNEVINLANDLFPDLD